MKNSFIIGVLVGAVIVFFAFFFAPQDEETLQPQKKEQLQNVLQKKRLQSELALQEQLSKALEQLAKAKTPEDLLNATDKIIQLKPKESAPLALKAALLMDLDRPQEALPLLNKALQFSPDNKEIRELRNQAKNIIKNNNANSRNNLSGNSQNNSQVGTKSGSKQNANSIKQTQNNSIVNNSNRYNTLPSQQVDRNNKTSNTQTSYNQNNNGQIPQNTEKKSYTKQIMQEIKDSLISDKMFEDYEKSQAKNNVSFDPTDTYNNIANFLNGNSNSTNENTSQNSTQSNNQSDTQNLKNITNSIGNNVDKKVKERQKDPNLASNLLKKAEELKGQGKTDEAKEMYEKALEEAQKNGDRQTAKNASDNLKIMNKENITSIDRDFELGQQNFNKGNYKEAQKNFANLYEKNKKPETAFNYALASQAVGDNNLAYNLYKEVLESKPNDYYSLLGVAQTTNNVEEARANAQKALEQNSDNPDAHVILASTYEPKEFKKQYSLDEARQLRDDLLKARNSYEQADNLSQNQEQKQQIVERINQNTKQIDAIDKYIGQFEQYKAQGGL